jgi:uncharacterized protein (TIGR02996 family)
VSDQALLDAIVANPDDDAPRMVYADLLESRGDPRGEFIQLQCRAAQSIETIARQNELERAHASTWLAPILALKLGARFTFRRGFVDEIQGRFPAVVENAEVLATHAPLLHAADLGVDGQRDRDRLATPASSPVLRRLRSLRVFGKHKGETRDARGPIAKLDGLRELGLSQLRAFVLETLRAKGSELRALVETMPSLEALTLKMRLPPRDTHELVPHLPPLRLLDLSSNRIDADTFTAWLAGDHTRLETLVLDGTLAADAIRPILETRMPALRRLSLSGTHAMDNALARELAAWTTAQIELRQTYVSPELIEELANRATS